MLLVRSVDLTLVSSSAEYLTRERALDFGLIGLLLAFALLHLLLFLSYPRERGNLYYCLFALSVAANFFADQLYGYTTTELIQFVAASTSILGATSYIAFLFVVISDRVPLAVPVIGLLLTILMVIGRITPNLAWAFWMTRLMAIFLVALTALVLAVRAVQRKLDGGG